jgi:hypothetical protein
VVRQAGDMRIRVPLGTQVVLAGFTLLGDHNVRVNVAGRRNLTLRVSGILGGVEVEEA